jgi:hypothetical protein
MKSLGAMVKQISGLAGTNDVTVWESTFCHSINEVTANGSRTDMLSAKQVEIIERIYNKHFGDG